MHLSETLEQTRPGLLGRIQTAIQNQSLNQRTRQHYLHWIARFVIFCDSKTPESLDTADQQLFLHYLQDRAQVSRAKLNQASQALGFFFEKVLGKPAGDASRSAPLPT